MKAFDNFTLKWVSFDPKGEGLLHFLYGSPYLHWVSQIQIQDNVLVLFCMICVGESPLKYGIHNKIREPKSGSLNLIEFVLCYILCCEGPLTLIFVYLI